MSPDLSGTLRPLKMGYFMCPRRTGLATPGFGTTGIRAKLPSWRSEIHLPGASEWRATTAGLPSWPGR